MLSNLFVKYLLYENASKSIYEEKQQIKNNFLIFYTCLEFFNSKMYKNYIYTESKNYQDTLNVIHSQHKCMINQKTYSSNIFAF